MEGEGAPAVSLHGLNSVSYHLRSASPSCPPPLRVLRDLKRCLFHCLVEWKWAFDGLPETAGLMCDCVRVASRYRHFRYLPVRGRGPVKPVNWELMFRHRCTNDPTRLHDWTTTHQLLMIENSGFKEISKSLPAGFSSLIRSTIQYQIVKANLVMVMKCILYITDNAQG